MAQRRVEADGQLVAPKAFAQGEAVVRRWWEVVECADRSMMPDAGRPPPRSESGACSAAKDGRTLFIVANRYRGTGASDGI